MGVDALRVASWKAGSDYFSVMPRVRLENKNHLLAHESDTPNAKYIEAIYEVHEILRREVYNTVKSGNHFPIVLAGDHSSSAGSIAGIKLSNPEARLGVIWVDAHGDLHSPYTTPSGNVHGMPLAMALNRDNMSSQEQDIGEVSRKYWNLLKNSGDVAPKILPDDLVFFALRDIEKAEERMMEKEGVKNFPVSQLRSEGIATCVSKALEILSECDYIYLSFDVDSMDCDAVSDGTGTPVKNGLLPDEAEEIMKLIIRSGKVACFDMVEVNPALDTKGNVMAETSFKILESVTKTIQEMIVGEEIGVENGN